MIGINKVVQTGPASLEALMQATNAVNVAFAELCQVLPEVSARLDPLRATGFDDDERGQIVNLCSAAGWDPVQFGQMIMPLRPIPQIDWKDLFIFSWHWRIVARQAFWLVLALVVAAVMG